ncbi:MAG: hypothetical protein H6607_08155 [Flavobacteriales bacterium]|nr:hypothetical protein [Flavobacteriales bacterium]
MSITKENNIIKNKLQQVDIPDVDQSWAQMSSGLDTAPTGNPVSWWSVLAKYKLYLNIFLGLVLLTGVAAFFVNRSNSKSNHIKEAKLASLKHETGFANYQYYPSNYMKDFASLPVAERLPIKNTRKVRAFKTTNKVENYKNPFTILPYLLPRKWEMQQNLLDEWELNDLSSIEMGGCLSRSENIIYDRRFDFGVNANLHFLPEINVTQLPQSVGMSLFGRGYITQNSALQVELGYMPINIRPLQMVSKQTIFNNPLYTQTDSVILSNLEYVTLPISYYIQTSSKFGMNVGVQYSWLSGLRGNKYTTYDYPGNPENTILSRNTHLKNNGNIAQTDISFIAEINFEVRNRLNLGMKAQMGFKDYTTDQLSTAKHTSNSLQIKGSWTFGK